MPLHNISYCRHADKSNTCKFTNLLFKIRIIRFLKLGYVESLLSFCILLSTQNGNSSTKDTVAFLVRTLRSVTYCPFVCCDPVKIYTKMLLIPHASMFHSSESSAEYI